MDETGDIGRTVGGCSDLESRAAYLGGLVKGLDLAAGSEQGRVLQEMVDLLGDVVREVTRLADRERAVSAAPSEAAPGARRDSPPVFVACECPRCGEDIFIEAEAFRTATPEGSGGVRLLVAPSVAGGDRGDEVPGEALAPSSPDPAFMPREFEITCSNCGETFLVREKAPREELPRHRRRGPDSLHPRRPERRPSRQPRH